MNRPGVLLLVLPSFLAASVTAQEVTLPPDTTTISGVVFRAHDRRPIPFAYVFIPELKRAVLTNQEGRFAFPAVTRGRYEIRARLIGYELASIWLDMTRDSTRNLRLALRRDPESRRIEVLTPERWIPGRGTSRHRGAGS